MSSLAKEKEPEHMEEQWITAAASSHKLNSATDCEIMFWRPQNLKMKGNKGT